MISFWMKSPMLQKCFQIKLVRTDGTQVYPLRFPSNSSVPFRLSTLNESIELLLGLNRATGRQRQLLIEIKKAKYHTEYNRSISSVVLASLNAYNLIRPTDPVILQTFHIEELMHIRRNLSSQLRFIALMTLNRIGESSSEGPTNLTKWAHQYNLSVYSFIFRANSYPGSSFEGLIEYFWHTVRVDGFITDHPDLLPLVINAVHCPSTRRPCYINFSMAELE